MSGRDDVRDLVEAYALGVLEPEEARAFEARMAGDAELAADVANYREMLAEWSVAESDKEPPPDGLSRVLSRIRSVSAEDLPESVSGQTGSARVDYDQLAWEDTEVPGMDIYWLTRGAEGEESIVLLRGQPGSRYPDHLHPTGERGFVLQGTFSDALGVYPTGSYLEYPPGSVHRNIRVVGDEVCVFLVITAGIAAAPA